MNINIQYQPTARELARASLIFVEKKPFILFIIMLANIFIGFFFVVFTLKLIISGLNLQEVLAALGCGLILFGRKPLNQWVLYSRMKNSRVIDKPISIDISLNGIAWEGKSLRQGHIAWNEVKYIFEVKNGYIMPNAFTRFLWLPFRGFSSPKDIEHFRKLIKDKQIVLRVFSRWEC